MQREMANVYVMVLARGRAVKSLGWLPALDNPLEEAYYFRAGVLDACFARRVLVQSSADEASLVDALHNYGMVWFRR